MIKVWDYLKEYELLREEILSAVDDVFKGGTLIFGPRLEEFEEKFSKYHDCKFGIGVGNCTDAITIALKALDIGFGDEVITTSNTAVPTVTAIVNTGASVKFVDINEYDYDLVKKSNLKQPIIAYSDEQGWILLQVDEREIIEISSETNYDDLQKSFKVFDSIRKELDYLRSEANIEVDRNLFEEISKIWALS